MESLCISFTVITSITIITLSSYLDGNNDNSGLFFVFYAIITSFIINNIVLCFWKRDIQEFLATSAEESSQEDEEESVHPPKNKSEKEQNWIINTAIPRFLTKFSSTYFKKAEITSAYLKEKIKQKNTKKPSKEKMKQAFSNQKSQSYSNFEKHLYGVDPKKIYKLNEKDSDNARELIKTKHTRFDIPKSNVITTHGIENQSMDPMLELSNSQVNPPPHNPDFYLIEQNEEKYSLPNQILPEIKEKHQNRPQRNRGDESPEVQSPFKISHKKSLNVEIPLRHDSEEKKKFPHSATLPINRNISGLLDQIRKQSNQEIKSPMHLKKSESNLNQTCLVCFDNPSDAVFMNCGHGGICYGCALEIFKATKECYLCRSKIHQVLQIDTKVIADDYIKVIQGIKMPSIME